MSINRYAIIENGIVVNIMTLDSAKSALIPKTAVVIPEPKVGWLYDGTTFKESSVFVSTKPYLYVTADKTTIKADGYDTAVVTATLKDMTGNVLTGVNVLDYAVIQGYGALEVAFVNGVATIEFRATPDKSGKLAFGYDDSTKYIVVEPLIIYAVL
jgi:hypothetical protein